jgi:hypothetical protein
MLHFEVLPSDEPIRFETCRGFIVLIYYECLNDELCAFSWLILVDYCSLVTKLTSFQRLITVFTRNQH